MVGELQRPRTGDRHSLLPGILGEVARLSGAGLAGGSWPSGRTVNRRAMPALAPARAMRTREWMPAGSPSVEAHNRRVVSESSHPDRVTGTAGHPRPCRRRWPQRPSSWRGAFLLYDDHLPRASRQGQGLIPALTVLSGGACAAGGDCRSSHARDVANGLEHGKRWARQRYSRPSSTSAPGNATRSWSYSYMCFHGSRSPWRNIRSCERMT